MSQKCFGRVVSAVFALSMIFGVGSTPAQQPVIQRPNYGGADDIYVPYSPAEFVPTSSSTVYELGLQTGLTSAHAAAVFGAPVRLPAGALLTGLELDYEDFSPTQGVVLALYSCEALHITCTELALLNSATGPEARAYVYENLTPQNYTVNNFSKWLELRIVLGGPEVAFLGAFISYKLQVSPAPASATFADVPTTHPYFRFVEALVNAGITSGCSGGNYCPNSPITRGEMAVFLAAALGLHYPN